METLLEKHWHHLETEEVASLLDIDPNTGLDQFEVEKRQSDFGQNVISGKKATPAWERFLLQFHQPLIYILIVSGIITAFLGQFVDASVIFGVVAANALIGYFQETKAVRALDSLTATMSVEAVAFRAEAPVRLPAVELVPGDIVILRSGDKVPADLRLLSCRDLQVDESTLTGESAPVNKNADSLPRETLLADRQCMAYAGTFVRVGQGLGFVVATGDKTEIGRISHLIESADELETPLTRKISAFSHRLLIAILLTAGIAFAAGLARSESVHDMFMAAVAIAVGAIPEGLPAAVTIILALGVARMAKRKAIIRKLPAVETLGGTTVICSDKTGTLTENQMTVQSILSGGSRYSVTGTGYGLEGTIVPRSDGEDIKENAALEECLRAGLLCGEARLRETDGRIVVEGDPTEGALMVAAAKMGLTPETESQRFPQLDAFLFESERQYMATLHEHGDGAIVYMKGAVEKVLSCCVVELLATGETGPMDTDAILREAHAMASGGMRVLALARKRTSGKVEFTREAACTGMEFLGLQGMLDPPREEAKQAVAACQRAGVTVKMITGDHPATAQAIGRMLGLRGSECTPDNDCRVMTGADIQDLSDRELTDRVADIPIFARVTPEQKLRLVMALQKHGEVCAMTGDGVNDAPALKQSDIGVAMGISGTEVAKEAADMVLIDDNFATIEAAVEEGRGVFANLVKFIAWTIPTNAGEGLVVLSAILLGATLPILPVQILWINMTTAGCLGITLAFEPKEPGTMDTPPRQPDAPLLGKEVIRRMSLVSVMLLICAFGMFQWELDQGTSLDKARTIAVNVFVVVEAFYLFNSRSITRSPFALGLTTNPWVIGGFVLMMVFQAMFTYLPFMNTILSSAPLGLVDWLKIFLCGLGVFLLVELDKLVGKARK